MGNIQFINLINLDTLSDIEIEALNKLIIRYGFCGNLAGISAQIRLEYLIIKCDSRFKIYYYVYLNLCILLGN